MKALTLHQPWASLVAVGAKTIETRPRGTAYRGPLAIHAGLRKPSLAEAGIVVDNLDAWNLWYAHYRSPDLGVMPLGAVVASARLVDVVRMGWGVVSHPPFLTTKSGRVWLNDRNEIAFGHYEVGRFAWLLEDVAATTERCPWCWGEGAPPCNDDHDDKRTRIPHRHSCPVCAGAGKCDPVPASGRQATPWEWTP